MLTGLFGIITGFLLLAGYLMARSQFRVEEGHRAIVTTFGAAQFEEGRRLKLIGPGLHWKWPWQHSRDFSVMERISDVSDFYALTKDATQLRLDCKLRIQPMPENLYAYLFEMRDPISHIQNLFECLLREEVANFNGSYESLRKERHHLSQKLEAVSDIGSEYGVKFNAVDITDMSPPEELARALNAVQNEQALANAQYERALAERDQKLAAAEQAVEIATARAQAVASEILILGEALEEVNNGQVLPEYLERRRTEVFAGSRWSLINHKRVGA